MASRSPKTPGRRTGRRSSARPLRVGVALGAGGARGLAHVGVLRSLADAGVPINGIVGTSIGALVGAMYAAGQLENFERQMKDFEWGDAVRLFDPVWPRSGLLSGTRAVDWLGELIGDWRIEDLAIPFAAVSVDLVTGNEIIIRKGRVLDALRASMSIPGVMVPFRQGRKLLVDGALRNPVPHSALATLEVDVRIAVNLHHVPVREIVGWGRTPARRGAKERLADAIDRRLARLLGSSRRPRKRRSAELVEQAEPQTPSLFDILTASMAVVEYELARHRLTNDPPDLVLEPDLQGIRAFEFHKARRAIRRGSLEVERRLPEIQRVLRARPGSRGVKRKPQAGD
ncbi:MAG: patatin-like phospholipase family protein [Myxococcales bacterium]|nr:patatin-like phospholipase family protein [Myxococcales bacterium]